MTNMFSSHKSASAFALALFAVSTVQVAVLLSGPVTAMVMGTDSGMQPMMEQGGMGQNQMGGQMGQRQGGMGMQGQMGGMQKGGMNQMGQMNDMGMGGDQGMMRGAAGGSAMSQGDRGMMMRGQNQMTGSQTSQGMNQQMPNPMLCEALKKAVEASNCAGGQGQMMRQQGRGQMSTGSQQ